MDHSQAETATQGPWPLGWAIAALAGAVAFVLASAIAGAGFWAAFSIAALSFGVFGVLLGAGGVERTAPSDSHDASVHADDHH
jgi:hypothetical protein